MIIASIELCPTDPYQLCVVPDDVFVTKDAYLIISTSEGGEEAAIVKHVYRDTMPEQLQESLGLEMASGMTVLRIATEHDRQRIDANERMVDSALTECEQLIEQHRLEMRLVTAHFSFDGRQVLFVFTAESRVDFRALVKDLAQHFKRRVRLKQIGPRDRARYVGQKYGAYGRCGRPLCCATFLRDLDSVTMDMVRAQNLEHKGAAKVSGVCGKLMNCLAYEVDMYKEFRQELPELGSRVRTKTGEGRVVSCDILSQMITVSYDDESRETVHSKDAVVVTSISNA